MLTPYATRTVMINHTHLERFVLLVYHHNCYWD